MISDISAVFLRCLTPSQGCESRNFICPGWIVGVQTEPRMSVTVPSPPVHDHLPPEHYHGAEQESSYRVSLQRRVPTLKVTKAFVRCPSTKHVTPHWRWTVSY